MILFALELSGIFNFNSFMNIFIIFSILISLFSPKSNKYSGLYFSFNISKESSFLFI